MYKIDQCDTVDLWRYKKDSKVGILFSIILVFSLCSFPDFLSFHSHFLIGLLHPTVRVSSASILKNRLDESRLYVKVKII